MRVEDGVYLSCFVRIYGESLERLGLHALGNLVAYWMVHRVERMIKHRC
jgi:hypothetical protein